VLALPSLALVIVRGVARGEEGEQETNSEHGYRKDLEDWASPPPKACVKEEDNSGRGEQVEREINAGPDHETSGDNDSSVDSVATQLLGRP
jgi:hypothetical protein